MKVKLKSKSNRKFPIMATFGTENIREMWIFKSPYKATSIDLTTGNTADHEFSEPVNFNGDDPENNMTGFYFLKRGDSITFTQE